MRLDVPIPMALTQQARGRASVGVAVDVEHVCSTRESPRVAIGSWSMSTVLGKGSADTFDALLNGSAIDDHARLVRFAQGQRRVSRLAECVATQLTGVGFDRDAAVIVGTSKGAVEDWFSPPPIPSPGLTSDNLEGGLDTWDLGGIAAELARSCRTRGPVLTVSAACASGLHALTRGAMMIRSGEVRQALVVAAEASVHPLFLGSFQRLGVLAKPGAGCRPFDRNRAGFYMSEAAAAVLLEAAEPDGALPSRRAAAGRRRHRHPPVYLDDFALGGDATHLTGGDPESRVLKRLLSNVIDGRPVDLIHAHGTGTETNDATELAAIEATVGDGRPESPVVYSHKAALGHSLGASGLVSVVLNCMCHATGKVPPNVRTTDPLPTTRVTIPRGVTTRPVRRSLAIAAGFGGPVAVVGLSST